MTTYDPYPYATAHDIRAHYQSVPVAVLIPAAQSLFTGLSLGISAGAIAWLIDAARPWQIGVSTAALSQTLAWLLLIYGWQALLYKMERALGIDLDQDGSIGSPAEKKTIRLEIVQNGGRQIDLIDLPVEEDQFKQLVYGLTVQGLSLSEGDWTGKGKPFSRAEWHNLRDTLITRGLAYWINPRARSQGFALNVSGKNVLRRYAAESGIIEDLQK